MAIPIEELREELFILGAGFSRAISDNMPLLAELTESSRRSWMERDSFPSNVGVMSPDGEFKQLRHPSETSAISRVENSVETWLSCLLEPAPFVRASSRWAQRALALEIIESLRQNISHGESNTLTSDPPGWLMLMAEYWILHGSSIVTFNYDTLVERAITEHFKRLSRPCTSAHLFPFFTDGSRPGYPGGYPERPCSNCVIPGDPPYYFTSLYKLHGSTNWYYSGSDIYAGETLYQIPVMGWTTATHVHGSLTRTYDYEAVAGKAPLIIPPVMNKSPRFQHEAVSELWHRTQSSLRKATRIFAIGYSLPSADTAFQHLLHWDSEIQELHATVEIESGTNADPPPHKTMYIVNSDEGAVDWYRRRLGCSYEIDGTYTGPNAVERFVEDLPNL